MELSDLCFTSYSELEGVRRKEAHTYLTAKLAHSDEGSEFAQKVGRFKYLFRIPYLGRAFVSKAAAVLTMQGYDAIFMFSPDEIIGHAAFQMHEDGLHTFSVEVKETHRRKGLSLLLYKHVIGYTRNRGISDMRLSGGGNDFAVRVYRKVCDQATVLGIIPKGNYWVAVESIAKNT